MNNSSASRRFARLPISFATVLRALAVISAWWALPAHAQETILDNSGAAYTTTGTWNSSTAVSGFHGANYHTRLPGPSPDARVVDNTDAGFSTLGTWTASTAIAGYAGSNYRHHFANGEPPAAVVVDNTQGTAIGSWSTSTTVGGYYATNYRAAAAGTGAKQFNWALPVTSTGHYDVYARWTAHANRAGNAPYTVNHDGGSTVITVNQKANGGQWVLLGRFRLDPNLSPSVNLTDQANGYVIADAVMAVPEGATPNTATWALDVATPGSYKVYARWTAHANRASNAAYTITHAGGSSVVTVDQQANGGQWNLLGSFSLDPANSPTVSVTDRANGYVIADAVMAVPGNAAPNRAQWTIAPGTYEVYARWTAHPNRASNAPYTVNHAQGASVVTVNQQSNGAQWNLLGRFTFNTSANTVTLTDEADGYVVADAIRLVSLAPAQAQTYYIHADHLNTPRVITDQAQQVVWRWDNDDPFGANMANENPSGLGTFTCNLRFPGQYFDRETNLHYNYFRDYSPEIGRYIESDPIGLRGGLNTYAYTDSDPLRFTDPLGLQSGSDVFGERPRPQVGWPNVSQQAQQSLAQQLQQLWNNIVNQSNDELERCKQDCEADRKRDQDDCEWWWKMRGRNAEDYRRCQRAADEQLMKCYDNCRKTCK